MLDEDARSSGEFLHLVRGLNLALRMIAVEPRTTSDVNISEERAPARVGRKRPNTQRRANTLPIDNGRAGKPGIAPRDVMERIDRLQQVAPTA
jgi:hypothetical protein